MEAKTVKSNMTDMTQGSPAGLILFFALPLLVGNMFQQLYNMVDSIVVGRFVGSTALAAVGTAFPVVFLLSSMFMGLGIGAMVMVSQFYGAGEMMVPMISSLAALWLARVPAAYLLAHFFGPMHIHFCYAIGWALGLAICVPYYFSGRWKEKSIVARAAGGC